MNCAEGARRRPRRAQRPNEAGPSLLQKRHSLFGFRGRGGHIASLAGGLRVLDELLSVRDAGRLFSLTTRRDSRRLNVLTRSPRSLDVLAGSPRRLDVLTRSPRRLNVLTRRARRLNVL